MTRLLFILPIAFLCAVHAEKPKPKVTLCVGNYQTEAQAVEQLKRMAATHGNLAQWKVRAAAVRLRPLPTADALFSSTRRRMVAAAAVGDAEHHWPYEATQLAVEMYTKANQWERAHKLASSYMTEREVGMLYIAQAQKLEAMGQLNDRERFIVRERKLRDQPRTLESLGTELGLSKERVRQLEAAAFGKMRKSLETQCAEVHNFLV